MRHAPHAVISGPLEGLTKANCFRQPDPMGRDWLPDHRVLNSFGDVFYPVSQQSKGGPTEASQGIQRSRLQGYAPLFLCVTFAVCHQRQHAGSPSRNCIGLIQQIQ